MKRPSQSRRGTKREIDEKAQSRDLHLVASQANYIGSPYHKSRMWFGKKPPKRRAKATTSTLCPDELHQNQKEIQLWLSSAIQSGAVGQWSPQKAFPKRVWFKQGETVFEAMGDENNGYYHGYPLRKIEWPLGIEKITFE